MKKHISEKQLVAFIDDEVADSEYNLIQDHLDTCEQCASYAKQMQLISASLDTLKSVPENPDLINDTMKLWRLAKQPGQPSRGSFVIRELKKIHKLLTLGAMAAGLAIGFLFGDLALRELLFDDNGEQNVTIVLQEDDHTINDSYVSLIINDGR